MFERTRDHIHHYRALIGSRGGAIAMGTIRGILCDFVREEFAATIRKNLEDAIPNELVIEYVVGAYMAVLT